MTRGILLPFLALLAAAPAAATTAFPASVEELARGSDAVVRGVVVGRATRPADGGRLLYTFVEVRTAKVWRGEAPATVTVRVPGGSLGRVGQRVAGAPELRPGEEVVLFLRRAGRIHQVTGLALGKFAVDGAQARPDLRGLQLLERALPAGERAAGEMPVAELEARVRGVR
jgi:hypothetical protein